MKYLPATEIARQINSGQLSSAVITEHYLSRIEQYNPQLNAFVDVYADTARAAATQRDQQPRDQFGPLHGVPISVKECYQVKDTRTTLNYPPLRNFVADSTSFLVQRLVDAGAILLGKTNVPTLLADAQTFGPLYPTCNNPHDLNRTPGGSTGGGAAALAADMCALELGSDIGGSIRNPSHFCGLYGLKPTENGHPNDGHTPPFPSQQLGFSIMNSTGPLARSAADLKLAYDVLYAPDWQQRLYLPLEGTQAIKSNLAEYRFGYLNNLMGLQGGQAVSKAMQATKNKLELAGAEVRAVAIDHKLARELLTLWVELFGFSVGQTLSWPIRKLFYWQFRGLLKNSSLPATTALKTGLSLDFKAYSRALKRRQELVTEVQRCYSGVDVVISPTCLGPAFPHNPKHKAIALDGDQIPYVDYCFPYVALNNLTGQPVLTVPTGAGTQDLPIGLSFAAAHHQDQTLLHLAKLLEHHGFVFHAPNFGND
ncbi:amidase [Pseudidiomarina sp. E22-M8]|uniref:amidase n=1 Tax=Pseudidiomarina sp. E22-M8 TaxID=3424768 RepID=UPI00403C10D3